MQVITQNGTTKVITDGEALTIDDKLVVTNKDGVFQLDAIGGLIPFALSAGEQAAAPVVPAGPNYETMRDPMYYGSGNNGMTVATSARYALGEVEEILNNYGVFAIGEDDVILGHIEKMIANGQGRHSVYRLVGGIGKSYKQGNYRGVPFSIIFDAILTGKMEHVEAGGATSRPYALRSV